jgi:hypothetical protein
MNENKHKPLGIAEKTYNKCSGLYSSVTGTPHDQAQKDMDMLYGMSGLFFGLMLSGFSLKYIFTFTLLTLLGLAGLVVSISLLKHSSSKVGNSFS